MSGSTTTRLIAAYIQMAAPTLFLSGFFQSPRQNFHNSEEVEIDIVRSEEDVSIVVEDLSTGYRMNSDDLYTNKGFKPPVHKEAKALNSFDLLKRMPGDNPFQNPDFRANLISRVFNGAAKVEAKIRRAVELQASQVLQTGKVTLINENGVALYELNYQPKASHFPTAGTAWNAAGSTKVDDLKSLTEVIRTDGLAPVDTLIFGVDAFEAAMQDDAFTKRFDNRRIDLGMVSPMQVMGNGGIYRGVVEIGNYKLDIWTYDGRYKHPQTGVSTSFIDPGKVVAMSSGARLDATFGAIPNIGALLGAQQTNLLPELPGRIQNTGGGMDLHTNVWLTNDGEQLFYGVGARPLMIPTAIDTYGCLDTGI